LDEGDDGIDLVIGQHPLEGLHHGTRLSLAYDLPELLGVASLPERGVAEVPRAWLERRRRRTVPGPVVTVAGRAPVRGDPPSRRVRPPAARCLPRPEATPGDRPPHP